MSIPRSVPGLLGKGTAAARRQQSRRCHPAIAPCASRVCLLAVVCVLLSSHPPADAADRGSAQDRRAVVFGPPKELAQLGVTKDCLSVNAKTVGVRSKTLTFTIKVSDCFIYAAPEGFEYLAVKDLHPLTKSGEPQLPVKTFIVELDKDAEVYGVEVVAGSFTKVQGEVRIVPSPQAFLPKQNWVIPDEAVYRLNTLFPGSLVRYDRGCDNERQHVFVRFFPLQYVPAKKEATIVTQATIRLYYGPGARQARLEGIPASGGSPGVNGRITTPSAKCVIICPSALQDQGQRLARFHTHEEGIRSVVVTTEAIRAAYTPVEDPPFEGWKNRELGGWKIAGDYDYALAKQIIAYLRDQAGHPRLEFVTILGDATLVPPSYYYYFALTQNESDYYHKWIPTDLFYASPDYDLVPNYHIGRLSVSKPAEASHVVEKLERWHGQAQAAWFKKVYLVNTWDLNRYDCFRKGFFNGFQVKRLAGVDDRVEKIYIEPAFTTADVGFVFIGLHGSGRHIRIGSSLLTVDDLMSYGAHDKVPMVFSISCDNGAFDLGLVKRSYTHSFGESLLLSKAGGIAYFGSSRAGTGVRTEYFYRGDIVTTHVKYTTALIFGYPLLAYRNGANTLGELNSKAVFAYMADNDITGDPINLLELFQHVLLGDPALKIPPWR